MEILYVIVLSLGAITTVFILTKIIGYRQMSQMSMFDYINGITIGSIAAEMATSLETDFLHPLTAMIVFGLMTFLISYLCNKSVKIRRMVEGHPLILFNDGEFRYDGIGKLELPDFDSTEPFHIEDSEPLESDSTKYDRYLMDGEWRKKEKVKTGGRTVKFDVEEEKLRILNKKLEFYKEVAFSIIMFLTMLSGVFFLVFAVIKLLS